MYVCMYIRREVGRLYEYMQDVYCMYVCTYVSLHKKANNYWYVAITNDLVIFPITPNKLTFSSVMAMMEMRRVIMMSMTM